MTHQNCTRNTLNEERFYVDGALVMASSLRRTEIKQILSVWSLQAFLRLLGRFREMTRGPVADTASAQHGLDRQNTLFNTKLCGEPLSLHYNFKPRHVYIPINT